MIKNWVNILQERLEDHATIRKLNCIKRGSDMMHIVSLRSKNRICFITIQSWSIFTMFWMNKFFKNKLRTTHLWGVKSVLQRILSFFFEGRYEIALVKLKWRGSKIGFNGVFSLSWFVVIAHYHDLRMWWTYRNSMDLNIKVRERILWKELQTFSFVVASC